jgi:hypothetical protein
MPQMRGASRQSSSLVLVTHAPTARSDCKTNQKEHAKGFQLSAKAGAEHLLAVSSFYILNAFIRAFQ